MNAISEKQLIDGTIAYFKFTKGAKPEDFLHVFPEFKEMVSAPEVDKMIVDVQADDVWGQEIQNVWIQTGVEAESAGIRRWAVITGDESKQMTIRHLIQGGRNRDRTYEWYVSDDYDDVLRWIRRS